MITVELTEEHLEILTEGALRYGRIAIGVKSTEGDDDVIIVYAQTHRRGRPPKPHEQPARRPRSPVDPVGTVLHGAPNGPAEEPLPPGSPFPPPPIRREAK